ncbi:hypothetical protein IWW36_005925, partial [Coemansia brasiliensis]
MNQNPFAFFPADANGYPQLPESLGQTTYLDTRSGLGIKDDSLHTSSMSHASHETDSNPSTPSKSRKSERRTPKSKAEVSERMRRWRSENAEKNRLNDLRCRVYRQARIRFGKEPTPEREAWIQSEIFRRLERRRLREAMKGNGSVPAPTAIANPAAPSSMNMGVGGGPLTRSRSTVHPFPLHMSQNGVAEHAMGFSASPYSMMPGNGMYTNGNAHQYHGDMHHPSAQHTSFNPHAHPMHPNQPHSSYLQSQAYGGIHHQQQQQQQGDTQLPHGFIPSASGALPSADIYSSFKFINPLYPGRLISPQSSSAAHSQDTALYSEAQQQQHMSQHPSQPLQHHDDVSSANTHTVPSHQQQQLGDMKQQQQQQLGDMSSTS